MERTEATIDLIEPMGQIEPTDFDHKLKSAKSVMVPRKRFEEDGEKIQIPVPKDDMRTRKSEMTGITQSRQLAHSHQKESRTNLMKAEEGDLEEVIFVHKAPVADCFPSVLKCWRIFQPNVINLENLDITDQHIE